MIEIINSKKYIYAQILFLHPNLPIILFMRFNKYNEETDIHFFCGQYGNIQCQYHS